MADVTDVAEDYPQSLEGLSRVRDASDPDERTVPGYMVFEAYARVGWWQLFPPVIEAVRTYRSAPPAEVTRFWGISSGSILQWSDVEHGYWTLGFDRRRLLVPMLKFRMAFLVRQRGDRHIRTADGQELSIQQRAAHIYQHEFPDRWPFHGWIHTETVFLPEAPEHELLLVLFRRHPTAAR